MRKMNFSYQTVLASALLASLPLVQAAEDVPFEFSANVALTSDYVWRGMSQNDEGWAIQGGFDITHETGFTLGTWASNVKFLEDDTVKPEDRADIEVDFYLGYEGEADNGYSYGIKAGRYTYPGAASDLNYDFNEYNIHVGYSMPQGTAFSLAYDYAPETFGDVGEEHHYVLAMSHSLPTGLGFSGYVAQRSFGDNDKAGDDYIYYGASLSFPIADFEGSISYSDTDLDKAAALKADERVFFTLSKSF